VPIRNHPQNHAIRFNRHLFGNRDGIDARIQGVLGGGFGESANVAGSRFPS
jgi:hypothetical protein